MHALLPMAEERNQKQEQVPYVAQISGNYSINVNMMIEKHKSHKIMFESSTVIMIDSFDGANHLLTDFGSISLTSYSSQLFSLETFKQGNSTCESHNILTWQQVMANENSKNVLPAVRKHYEEKSHLQKEGFCGKKLFL